MSLNVVDVLRLEVATVPAGLVNLVQNPSGELGTWGWITPVAGTSLFKSAFYDAALSFVAATGPSHFTTEKLKPVAAGDWVGASWFPLYVENFYRARLEWLDASENVLGYSVQTAYRQATNITSHYAPVQAPAGTVAARLRFDIYANVAGGSPDYGDQFVFTEATVATAATADELVDLGYLDPVQYINVLGPTHDIKITRDELNVGLLTATIRDAALDPASADTIRRGQRVRATSLDPATGAWEPIFTGKVSNANVTYDYKTPSVPAGKRARITLSAVDHVSVLAATPRAEGVVEIINLTYLLEGAGVPWSCNGFGGQSYFTPTIVARNPDASLLDQIAITRDTALGYAWVDRRGILQAWDNLQISTAVAGVLDAAVYSDLDIDYDTDRAINTINIKYLRLNAATGETVEVPYGPYVNQASVDRWGVLAKDFTIQGIEESEAHMKTYADMVLAASATPVVRVNSVTVPIRTAPDVARSLLDLHDLVTVSNTGADLTQNLRITGIEHTITADARGGKWLVKYLFASDGGVAPPQATPSAGVTVSASSDGVEAYAAGNEVTTTDANGDAAFTFGRTYQAPPVVVGTGGNAEVVWIRPDTVTTTGFVARFRTAAGAPVVGPVRLFWIALPATK